MNEKFIVFNVVLYSSLSGILAFFVSLCVKLAFNLELLIDSKYLTTDNNNFFLSDSKKFLIKIVFIGFSFVLNSLMWIFYSKSLHLSTSTLFGTALNKFSNFISSAVFGFLIFKENIHLSRWLFGLLLLLVGILILNQEQGRQQNVKNAKKELSTSKKE